MVTNSKLSLRMSRRYQVTTWDKNCVSVWYKAGSSNFHSSLWILILFCSCCNLKWHVWLIWNHMFDSCECEESAWVCWPLPWGSCHARREHVMNMYRQAVAAPCNLRLAGNYLRENGPEPVPPPPRSAPSHRNESLIARELRCRHEIAAHAPVVSAAPAQTRRLPGPTDSLVVATYINLIHKSTCKLWQAKPASLQKHETVTTGHMFLFLIRT